MAKNKQKEEREPAVIDDLTIQEEQPTIIDDPTLAGMLQPFEVVITPFKDDVTRRTCFKATGNVKEALEKIAANFPVGSRDALASIKNCRSMIWLLKGGR